MTVTMTTTKNPNGSLPVIANATYEGNGNPASNYPTASEAMKNTGMRITAIVALLNTIGLVIIRRKQK